MHLTCYNDTHIIDNENIIRKGEKHITFLDIDVFKTDNTIRTREHRKDTSAKSYLKYNFAYPRHIFAGIIKSQLHRLRRLCSRNIDYENAVVDLKQRCIKSEYPITVIDNILNTAPNIIRTITKNPPLRNQDETPTVSLVVLSGTSYDKQFSDFATKMNNLSHPLFKVELVKSTFLSISKVLFHNCVNMRQTTFCTSGTCIIWETLQEQ